MLVFVLSLLSHPPWPRNQKVVGILWVLHTFRIASPSFLFSQQQKRHSAREPLLEFISRSKSLEIRVGDGKWRWSKVSVKLMRGGISSRFSASFFCSVPKKKNNSVPHRTHSLFISSYIYISASLCSSQSLAHMIIFLAIQDLLKFPNGNLFNRSWYGYQNRQFSKLIYNLILEFNIQN